MAKEIVYILTNPSLNGWIKIGFTAKDDITDRLNALNNSEAIPLDFRVYAVLYCDNAHKTEGLIHDLFDNINPELHAIEQRANGKMRKKEFFQISPEKAYEVMDTIVKFAPEKYELVIEKATKEQQEIENIVEEVSQKEKRTRTTFKMLGIPIGAELVFSKDSNVKCIVVDEINTVKYNDEEFSISNLAWKLTGRSRDTGVNGFYEFLYEDERLWDRRMRLETECNI
ncbi:MAG: GIY-YIG nuclease family protein [Alphaproteobacteria bacterium]|nr:GIY-YIG nuclease family protein [Alphaproteobacteria bacterium]